MTRPLADLANDLRNLTWYKRADGLDTVACETIDVLDLLARHLPPPACDNPHCPGQCAFEHCDNGRLALDEWLRRVGALWVWTHSSVPDNLACDFTAEQIIDIARQVGL